MTASSPRYLIVYGIVEGYYFVWKKRNSVSFVNGIDFGLADKVYSAVSTSVLSVYSVVIWVSNRDKVSAGLSHW